jgi:hypothetical protein
MQKRHLGSLLLAAVVGAASVAHAQYGARRDRGAEAERESRPSLDPEDYRQFTRQGSRRGEIERVNLSDRELDHYRRRFEERRDWRPQGVTYGLVGPLQRQEELTFLDDALLVGSYRARGGGRVFVYLFDLRGERHQMQVRDDGAILEDRIV